MAKKKIVFGDERYCDECKGNLIRLIQLNGNELANMRKLFFWVVGGLAFAGMGLTAYFYGRLGSDHDLLVKTNAALEHVQRDVTDIKLRLQE